MNTIITAILTYKGLIIIAFFAQLIANIIIIVSINRKVTILQRIAEEDFRLKYPREYKSLTRQNDEDVNNDDKLTKQEIIMIIIAFIIFLALFIMIDIYN